ncbi:MAG: glycosyltransferase family 2 protein [Candidatus Woesearchaeota archaeon]|nr:glycosyltransferase family 2 protein [Candidatus Woesearchaeota archaeon]
MKLSVTIPVYNEAQILEECIGKLNAFLKAKKYDYEIIIADNASTDETKKTAEKLCKKYKKARYIKLKEKGRGRALKKAWNSSNADILCYMDSDLATDLNNLPELYSAIKSGYDIAIGSRLIKGAKVKRTFFREILSRGYNLLLRTILKAHFRDAQCGFKAVSKRTLRDIIPKVKDNEWFFDTEMLVLAEKKGFRIKEIPVSWNEEGRVKKKEGKKERKSKVKIFGTILNYLKSIERMRRIN